MTERWHFNKERHKWKKCTELSIALASWRLVYLAVAVCTNVHELQIELIVNLLSNKFKNTCLTFFWWGMPLLSDFKLSRKYIFSEFCSSITSGICETVNIVYAWKYWFRILSPLIGFSPTTVFSLLLPSGTCASTIPGDMERLHGRDQHRSCGYNAFYAYAVDVLLWIRFSFCGVNTFYNFILKH